MERIKKEKSLDPITKLHITYGTVIMIMSLTFIVTITTMKSTYKNPASEGAGQMAAQQMPEAQAPDSAPSEGGGGMAAGMPPGGAGGMPPFVKKMVEEYKAAIEKNPKDTKALVGLANMYYDSGQYGKAIGYYEKVVEIEPSNTNAQADLGTCYYYTKVYDKAVTNLSASLKNDPTNLNARYNLGIVYKAQGKFDDARKEWEAMRPYLKTDEEKQRLKTVLEGLNKAS